MKKISILVILLISICSVSLFAQETVTKTADYPVVFQPGEKIAQAGLGFGMMGLYGDLVIPPISFSVDIAKEIEGFPLSFGGLIGIAKSEYDYSYWTEEYKWTYTYIVIGGRAAYHLKLDSPKIDPYGGVMLGYNIVSFTEPSGYSGTGYSSGSSYLMYGFYGGARYFFNPKMAVYAELGYGFGYLNLGISYKL
ncbi:MAG: hypothetical protein HOD64_07980 [Candidatus Cloacimonetes bacterium]|jgi:hypothetical protein|nr:hypothetical protein [Candidatus Cloacimonadota bacterium]